MSEEIFPQITYFQTDVIIKNRCLVKVRLIEEIIVNVHLEHSTSTFIKSINSGD